MAEEDGLNQPEGPSQSSGSPEWDESLRKEHRLARSSEFRSVMSFGSRGVSQYLVAFGSAAAVTGSPSRVGVVASRKVGGAVTRSRAKRLLRELYRRTPRRPAGDIVLVARRGIGAASWSDLERAYQSAIRMAMRKRRPRGRGPAQSASGDGHVSAAGGGTP